MKLERLTDNELLILPPLTEEENKEYENKSLEEILLLVLRKAASYQLAADQKALDQAVEDARREERVNIGIELERLENLAGNNKRLAQLETAIQFLKDGQSLKNEVSVKSWGIALPEHKKMYSNAAASLLAKIVEEVK